MIVNILCTSSLSIAVCFFLSLVSILHDKRCLYNSLVTWTEIDRKKQKGVNIVQSSYVLQEESSCLYECVCRIRTGSLRALAAISAALLAAYASSVSTDTRCFICGRSNRTIERQYHSHWTRCNVLCGIVTSMGAYMCLVLLLCEQNMLVTLAIAPLVAPLFGCSTVCWRLVNPKDLTMRTWVSLVPAKLLFKVMKRLLIGASIYGNCC